MKSIIAAAFTVAFVVAEVPSNSYLPPPPNRGYPRSSPPTIVAARTLDHDGHRNADHHAASGINGFARSGLNHDHDVHGAVNDGTHDHVGHGHAGHDHAGHDHGAQSRFNSNEEQGYDQNAAGFARNALDDINSTVSYESDERSFKPQSSYEESEELARSTGYDSNANNFRGNNGIHGNDHTGYHGNEQDGAHVNARGNGYN